MRLHPLQPRHQHPATPHRELRLIQGRQPAQSGSSPSTSTSTNRPGCSD
ncbi:hypothetical protein NKG94_02145 [Micromonospora sp. M12]